MFIDLHPIYECSKCKAIIDENSIVITKTDMLYIKQCPVCGCESLYLIKLED